MVNTSVPVITLDGPGGSGKGTISQLLAKRLDFHLLDSGAVYRALAYGVRKAEIALTDEAAIAALAEHLPAHFRPAADQSATQIFYDDAEVTSDIRTPEISHIASTISAYPAVRTALLKRQQDFRQAPGLVADGRDMATVVFPDAALKIFLTASAEIRAKRRLNQLLSTGLAATLPRILREMAERDARDAARTVAPMCAAKDAIILDNGDLTAGETLDKIVSLWQAKSLG